MMICCVHLGDKYLEDFTCCVAQGMAFEFLHCRRPKNYGMPQPALPGDGMAAAVPVQ